MDHEAKAKAEALTFWNHETGAEALPFLNHGAKDEAKAQVFATY